MARPVKTKLDWSPWDTDIFETDDKLFILLETSGWKGFGIYFFVCQQIYGSNGYSTEWAVPSSACRVAQKAGGGIGYKAVQEIISNCLHIGLFDKGLYDKWQILTSRGIQRRYAKALRERSADAKCVISEYWLLADAETQKLCPGLVKVGLNGDYPTENPNYPTENPSFPLLDKIREDNNTHTIAPRREIVEQFFSEHGCTDTGEVDAFIKYNEERGWKVADQWQHYAERFIANAKNARRKPKKAPKSSEGTRASFNTTDFYNAALARSYDEEGDT